MQPEAAASIFITMEVATVAAPRGPAAAISTRITIREAAVQTLPGVLNRGAIIPAAGLPAHAAAEAAAAVAHLPGLSVAVAAIKR